MVQRRSIRWLAYLKIDSIALGTSKVSIAHPTFYVMVLIKKFVNNIASSSQLNNQAIITFVSLTNFE